MRYILYYEIREKENVIMTQFPIELALSILVLMSVIMGITGIVAIIKFVQCQKMLQEELSSDYESIYPKKESDPIDEDISHIDESETNRDHYSAISKK